MTAMFRAAGACGVLLMSLVMGGCATSPQYALDPNAQVPPPTNPAPVTTAVEPSTPQALD
jgi:hypothetical protein